MKERDDPIPLDDVRMWVAASMDDVQWQIVSRFRFKRKKHINLQEIKAVISTVQRMFRTHPELAGKRIVIVVDSRVGKGAVRKGRSSSLRVNALLRQITATSLENQVTLEMLWSPTCANSGGAPTRSMTVSEGLGKKNLPRWGTSDRSLREHRRSCWGPISFMRNPYATFARMVL